jgi:hypothetical protein
MPKQIDRGPAGDEDAVKVTEAMGGATGGALGVGLGALLGPAGMIVGGLAGAAGGWWAGRGIAQAADDFSDETDARYQRLHDQNHAGQSDFDTARGFYRFGYLARRNPDYEGTQLRRRSNLNSAVAGARKALAGTAAGMKCGRSFAGAMRMLRTDAGRIRRNGFRDDSR